jgi:hypothetical protein
VIGQWYYELIHDIGIALIVSGADWLRDILGPETYTAEPKYLSRIKSYIEQGKLELSREQLGESSAYWDYLRDDLKPADLTWYRQPKGYDWSEARKVYENKKPHEGE